MAFWLSAGPDYTSGTLATTWEANNAADMAVGQTNLASDTNNYWQVTGVQLEVGSAATGFEFKDYGTELAECQRYYYRHVTGTDQIICIAMAYTAASAYGVVHFPVSLRAAPSVDVPSGTNYFLWEGNGANDGFDTLSGAYLTINACGVSPSSGFSGTAGTAGWFRTNNASAYIGFSAEF